LRYSLLASSIVFKQTLIVIVPFFRHIEFDLKLIVGCSSIADLFITVVFFIQALLITSRNSILLGLF
jgi:hypothetical protein